MIKLEEKQKLDFSNFRQKVKNVPRKAGRLALGGNIVSRWTTRLNNGVRDSFSLEEIKEIIRSGDISAAIDLSKYYYRTNGNYRNNINLLATLPCYDTIITPIYDLDKKKDKKKIVSSFNKANAFIDDLNVPVTFAHIS